LTVACALSGAKEKVSANAVPAPPPVHSNFTAAVAAFAGAVRVRSNRVRGVTALKPAVGIGSTCSEAPPASNHSTLARKVPEV